MKEYTVTEYAALRGITRQAVLSKIWRKVLKARRDRRTGIWVITVEA